MVTLHLATLLFEILLNFISVGMRELYKTGWMTQVRVVIIGN